jgi:hypothetical protein
LTALQHSLRNNSRQNIPAPQGYRSFFNMGESQKEIGKRQQTPDNFAFRHCPRNICIKLQEMLKQVTVTLKDIVVFKVK